MEELKKQTGIRVDLDTVEMLRGRADRLTEKAEITPLLHAYRELDKLLQILETAIEWVARPWDQWVQQAIDEEPAGSRRRLRRSEVGSQTAAFHVKGSARIAAFTARIATTGSLDSGSAAAVGHWRSLDRPISSRPDRDGSLSLCGATSGSSTRPGDGGAGMSGSVPSVLG